MKQKNDNIIKPGETQEIMVQAFGALLRNFQETRGTDHYEFTFKGHLWKVGVGLNGIINMEKHPAEEGKVEFLSKEENNAENSN